MEISTRDLVTVLHGMGFGALLCWHFPAPWRNSFVCLRCQRRFRRSRRAQTLLTVYLIGMVILAWLTVFSGAYIVYPWYRAAPPAGVTDLSDYPRRLLLSSGRTSEWHNIGMEWKENVAWLAPIAITMVAYVTLRYRHAVAWSSQMRTGALGFAVAAFVATEIAGAFGALLNKYAPVRGGSVIILMEGEQ